MKRILETSSKEGDVVLDPFCECRTTIAATLKPAREWIGNEITPLSVGLQKLRLKDSFSLPPLTQSQAGFSRSSEQKPTKPERLTAKKAPTAASMGQCCAF